MAEKYRLLRDAFGLKAGDVFEESRYSNIWHCPGRAFNVDASTVEDREWFEPVDDQWRPECGSWYWRVAATGQVHRITWRNDDTDKAMYAFRNCFRSEALAELAAEKVRQCLMQFHEEFTR
jgi:hypothetical protein